MGEMEPLSIRNGDGTMSLLLCVGCSGVYCSFASAVSTTQEFCFYSRGLYVSLFFGLYWRIGFFYLLFGNWSQTGRSIPIYFCSESFLS